MKELNHLIKLVLFSVLLCNSPGMAQSVFLKKDPSDTGMRFNNVLSDEVNFVYDEDIDNYLYAGGGVGLGDINNDGLLDIYLVGNNIPDRLYLNLGDFKFKDITDTAIKSGHEGWHTGVSMADINGDGLLDIYVSRRSISEKGLANLLYINQGEGQFIESAVNYGLDIPSETFQTLFFDQDLDGDLDAYILNSMIGEEKTIYSNSNQDEDTLVRQPDFFLINDGNLFRDQTKEKKLFRQAYGLGISAGDLDNNGTPDLYVANDFQSRDFLYLNEIDSFREEILERVKHISFYAMGSDIGDINNDGFLDIMVLDMGYKDHIKSKTNMLPMNPSVFYRLVKNGQHHQYMQNSLQLNNGSGHFSEIAQLSGVAKTDWSWAVLMADFNNDGWNDIAITNGIDRAIHDRDILSKKLNQKQKDYLSFFPKDSSRNVLFQNNKDLSFIDVSKQWGFEEIVNSSGIAYGDLDNDGDLDLVINNTNSESSIYENKNPEQNNFLTIELKNFQENTSAIGSRVTLFTQEGIQMKELYPVRGFQSSVDPRLHFGLSKIDKIDSILIRWPNLERSVLTDIVSNQFLTINYNSILKYNPKIHKGPENVFTKTEIEIDYTHKEKEFDDFERELLLPHKYSMLGPCMSIGDINKDGKEDIFIGGSKGFSSSVFLQNSHGGFDLFPCQAMEQDSSFEDVGSLLFDFDSDGDLDLYIASGSNECEAGDSLLQDRLYINDGTGDFIKSTNILPLMLSSTKEIQASDFDGDGDLDLFIGGRILPGLFPKSPESFLLRNEKTHFVDVSDKISPGLKYAGMVTSAVFEDIDNDLDIDLIVTGEWMPLLVFIQEDGHFIKQKAVKDSEGLWYSLIPSDIDNDGDIDFIGGNLGKNTKYKTSPEKPFQVYADDFDDNGSLDIVLSAYQDSINYPVRGRDCSSEQMPFIKSKFESFNSFANASIYDIFGDRLESAIALPAHTLLSSLFINNGKGLFTITPLSNEAQFAPLLSLVADDFNTDGIPDFFGVGNMYDTEVETVRYDAGRGLCLLGEGHGLFDYLDPFQSGISLRSDTRQVDRIRVLDKNYLVILSNSGKIEFWQYGID